MTYFLVFQLSCLQVVPLLMKAIGWQGGSILALETLKRVVVAGNRARDALVAQGLKLVVLYGRITHMLKPLHFLVNDVGVFTWIL